MTKNKHSIIGLLISGLMLVGCSNDNINSVNYSDESMSSSELSYSSDDSTSSSSNDSITSSAGISSSSITIIVSSSSSVSSSSVTPLNGSSGTFTDSRDGKLYKYVTIGTQTWMAENLNYSNENTVGWCYGVLDSSLHQDSTTCNNGYGRLYSYSAASDGNTSGTEPIQGICPDGWHIPSAVEFNTLSLYVADLYSVDVSLNASYLKSTRDWSDGTGTNTLGFNALPSGAFSTVNPATSMISPSGRGSIGLWWTSTSYSETGIYVFNIQSGQTYTSIGHGSKQYFDGRAIRCIHD